MPNDELKVWEVLQEKAVVYLQPSVWIVVNRCKVKRVSFIEGGYRSGGKLPSVSFGHVNLHLNTSRQGMPEINVGVLVVHSAVSVFEREMLTQWLVLN